MLPALSGDGLCWFKSRRSSGNGACVEVAYVASGGLAMRDSKDPSGPVLEFSAMVWREFVGAIRAGEFDRSA